MTPEEEAAAKLLADEAAVKLAEDEAARIAAEAAAEPELDDEGNPIVPPVEPWMEEADGEQDPDDPSQNVPVGKFVATKRKLKGQITERDDEIEKLKRENAELAKLKPQKDSKLVKPKEDDFDTADEYETAFDKYQDDKLQETVQRSRLEDKKNEAVLDAQTQLVEAVDSHYDRAAVLIEKSGIKPEVYQAADTTVRKAVEAVSPALGDVIVDQIISILGEGSEKVVYYLGRNKVALAKFQSLLVSDKSGMKAAVYLGQEKQRLTNPIKPRSNAPDPAAGIKGDVPTTGAEAKYKKKFNAADAKDNIQLAYDIKKEAKAAGVDVSKWT